MKGFTRRWKTIVLAAAALVLGGAGVVVNDGTQASAADTTFVYAGSGAAGIAIELFLPDSVIVNVGDTVEFVNPYEEPHTVTFLKGGPPAPEVLPPEFGSQNLDSVKAFDGSLPFSSGLMEKDDKLAVTFADGGKFNFLCLLHPGMEVDVTVVGAGTFLPPQGANSPEVKATIEAGLALGEAESAKTLAAVNAVNAKATDNWLVRTGPEVPFMGASVDVMRFLAPEVNIGVGDSVTWLNETNVPHTITFMPPGPPPSDFSPFVDVVPGPVFQDGQLTNALISAMDFGPFGGETEFMLTFNKAGTFTYICILHANQGMAGVVNVGPGAGGAPIKPPATGDAGLIDQSTGSWMMLTGIAMLFASLAAGVVVARKAA